MNGDKTTAIDIITFCSHNNIRVRGGEIR